jgi:hypothetical protein
MTVADTIWNGELRKGETAGTISGKLVDSWGWQVTLHGEMQPGGWYKLTGTIGAPPETLRVPAIDGESK